MKPFNTLLILSTSATFLLTGCDQESYDERDESEIAAGKADEASESNFDDEEIDEAIQACQDQLIEGVEDPTACDSVVDDAAESEDEDGDKWAAYEAYANCTSACVSNGWNLTVVGAIARGWGDSQEEANYSALIGAEESAGRESQRLCGYVNWDKMVCFSWPG